MSEFVVRTATKRDLGLMLDWAAAEGWNPGLDDASPLYEADPSGYLIGCLDGDPIACISVVAYGEDFGFLGFYICRPEFRGRGHGMAVWNAGIERLAKRTIGLDGVVAQQANYAKLGFAFAHNNIRYAGIVRDTEHSDDRLVLVNPTKDPDLANAIVQYDRPFFPDDRESFLHAWIASPRRTIAFVEDRKIRGYGTLRACRAGSKIGPLFADNDVIAEQLFSALAARANGAEVFLDAPEPNAAAIALAERHGLKPVFETARMYRGNAPDLPLDRIFGITTFELG